ncbi:hypothetical protein L228DRAFT_269478 [Xylona heveae TC161]|uniref:Zinc finger double-stranded RNA binding domain-containing protein n=1 Tax=Xylona heveae (strain CBS 132557 / TC161) TaxID=1328760 RepID=A0A165FK87_XYLHT|nr:hypothetical protein L228DRAFT_269478 [Xylona heveae TC161]KZF21076.1 hypothetical protein L228DRAFT_269478 [Xylona heveae TC161]
MTDVRSLLRSERASRRITHPYATYSSTGTLVCILCQVQLKSDTLWDTHLRSRQHGTQLQRLRDRTAGRTGEDAPPPTKKRKADDGENEEGMSSGDARETRKRTKSAEPTKGLPAGFFDAGQEPELEDVNITEADESGPAAPEETLQDRDEDNAQRSATITETASAAALPLNFFDDPSAAPSAPSAPVKSQPPPSAPTFTAVDEDEWAAFERDVAATEEEVQTVVPSVRPTAAFTAAATITAQPVSAGEVAARAEVEAATRNSVTQREAELEAEKEDAARRLEQEFDEMEDLEERVRRLRRKREELRHGGGGGATAASGTTSSMDLDTEDNSTSAAAASLAQAEEGSRIRTGPGPVVDGGGGGQSESDSDEDEDDDDDDDWDEWRLRGA